MTKKEKLIKKTKDNLVKVGAFSEYPQFCEEALNDIIPYLNIEGLKFLINDTQNVINQIKREGHLNPGWDMEDLE